MGLVIILGFILLIAGMGLILKNTFNLNIPLFRITVAAFLILLGIHFMIKTTISTTHEIDEEKQTFNKDTGKELKSLNSEYNVVFKKNTIDFTGSQQDKDKPSRIKINTVFGETTLLLDKKSTFKIRIDAAFADVELPNGNNIIFGTSYFESDSVDLKNDNLQINADVIFGKLNLVLD